MASHLLALVGYIVILVVSVGEAQNETSTTHNSNLTKLGPPVTLDPKNIHPSTDPTSAPFHPNGTTIHPRDGATPQNITTEAIRTEATSTEATTTKFSVVAGTNITQYATTEAATSQATTAQATTTQATTAEATTVRPTTTTQATLSPDVSVSNTNAMDSNSTLINTKGTTVAGITATTTRIAMGLNTTMATQNDTISVANATGLNTTMAANLTSGLGDNIQTATTVVPRSDNITTEMPWNNTCSRSTSFCVNGGTCYEQNNRLLCRCPTGWTGAQCESDVDECSQMNCDSHATCSNSIGGYNCTCKDGYIGNGSVCTFVNPCYTRPCLNGFCLSSLKSYQCYCGDGWRGSDCNEDVDECMEGTHQCQKVGNVVCVNTVGSYSCQCQPGYYGNASVKCTEDILYPSGVRNISMKDKNNTKMTVDVVGGFPYFGRMYYQMQINSNGYIAFGPDDLQSTTPFSSNSSLLSNVSIVAPYWSRIDLFHENDSSVVEVDVFDFWNVTLNLTSTRVRSLIVNHTKLYSNVSLEPQFAIVVTWKNVIPYPAKYYAGWENATFQVVLATDGSRSAAIINYAGDYMLWNPRSDNRTIVIGFTSPTDGFYKYTTELYRPDLATNVEKPGRFFFTLSQQQNNSHLPCIAWYQRQTDSLISSAAETMVPCPCTLQQALHDRRFVNDSQQKLCVHHRLKINSAVQLCCYDSFGQALIVGLGGGYVRIDGDETDGRRKCCQDADLCHLFYEKRPSRNCSNYTTPSIGAVWGDPHFTTFSGMQYSFNGFGEFNLFQLPKGLFQVQGRFERPGSANVNVTTLTAVAIKCGNYSAMELKVMNNVLTLYTSSLTYPLPVPMTAIPGAEAGESSSSSILIHFKKDVIIQVSVEVGFMNLRAHLPKPLLEGSDAMGLLLRRCPSSSALPPTNVSDNIDSFNYFKNCLLPKNESIFLYSLDGSSYESFRDPNFIPFFFTGLNESSNNSPFCGSSRSCLEDWIKTTDITRAVASRAFEDDLIKSRSKLANFPPVFGLEMPSVLMATVGQELRLNLNASDPEQLPVRFLVQTLIDNTEWRLLANDTFIWTPSQSIYNTTPKAAFLSFYAVDYSDVSALYWPFVLFCPCSADNASCYFDYPTKMDQQAPTGRLVIGRCRCRPGWTGQWCSESIDVCSLNPCYPGMACNSTAFDVEIGYTCGSCPSGLVRDGNQCYDLNECLTPAYRGCTNCSNLLGSYKCNCNSGYVLSKNKITCLDVDECLHDGRLCSKDGEFCHNLPGSYECLCHPDYYTTNSGCVYAPVKYGGKITFKAFNVSATKFLDWRDSLADNKSVTFKEVAGKVEALIRRPFVLLNGFVGTKVSQLQQGSIQVNYDLYFTPEANVNSSYLDDLLRRYLQDHNCEINGPDCSMSELIGVNANKSNVYDKDLCLSSLDNSCDSQTMNCRTEYGRAFCECKEGYQRVAENVEACEDFDECAPEANNCNMNMSVCVNTVGSYFCSCEFGFYMNNGSCSEVCFPNPCMNDGICEPMGDDFVCRCVGIWIGLNCTEENPEAVKLRNIAIGVGVGFGVLCLILIVVLIICCIRGNRTDSSYTCATSSNNRGNYQGRKSVNVHNWDPEEMEFQTNGNRVSSLDREAQPQAKPYTGNENPAYSDVTLERQRNNTSASKKSDYF